MRTRLAALLAVVLFAAGGCAQAKLAPQRWHGGEITIGTGPTNGVFNQLGGGYADVINRHMTGFEATAVPTNGAGENLTRLTKGDVDVAFTFADVAADAVSGTGAYAGTPLQIRALGRVFNSYTHLVVRRNAGITKIEDLRGKRVGTGPAGSGTEEVALRVMAAGKVGLGDITRTSASLNGMTDLMQQNKLDAMFYSAGLPTVGITAMMSRLPGQLALLPLDGILPALQKAHPGVYTAGVIPKAAYNLPADVATIAVPNMIVVAASLPDDIAYQLTKMLFEYTDELEAVHPEGKNIHKDVGAQTDPVLLHPGAKIYFAGG
ncbi:TAXI family TRAP transporter solute-binding subunit [Hamadaea tsunoensis]|uniref:TAXI family TRAP transporter solute-binding subunit n=1 Tax=Hamadaea tsunoensis TaxID=53368 RepID=UPI00040C7F9C|nr:TAXI family TRAP transporter solute-binding subunit [Hamadaea tsunoensis]